MPLPWKKSKGSRISRIVKDFQDIQSPKKENSLVVETGLPTIVDILVKNRDRLKKPSKKKKKKRHHQQQVVDELVITDPMPLASFEDHPDHVYAESKTGDEMMYNSEIQSQCSDRWELVREEPVKENVNVADDVDRCWNVETKRVMLVVLKMFVIVVLSLSTKSLAIGITMSAVALIFLEYLGEHILCFLKPCSNSRLVLESFSQRICYFLLALKRLKNFAWFRKSEAVTREGDAADGVSSVESCDSMETVVFSNPVEEEIQNVEYSPGCDNRCEALQQFEENPRKDSEACKKDLGLVQEDEDRGDGMACKKDRSQTRKSKRNFVKKLFTRRGKKNGKNKESDSEASSFAAEDKPRKAQVIEEQQDDYMEDSKDEPKRVPSLLKEGGNERGRKRREGIQVFDGCVSNSSIKLQKKMEMDLTKENTVVVDHRRRSYYLIAFVVVLAGLLGGRVLALLLTVASCFLLKAAGRWRRNLNGVENTSPAKVSG